MKTYVFNRRRIVNNKFYVRAETYREACRLVKAPPVETGYSPHPRTVTISDDEIVADTFRPLGVEADNSKEAGEP